MCFGILEYVLSIYIFVCVFVCACARACVRACVRFTLYVVKQGFYVSTFRKIAQRNA